MFLKKWGYKPRFSYFLYLNGNVVFIMSILKEMEYTTIKTREMLAEGELLGFQYYIVSYGTHPCCYIRIPQDHELFGKHYDDIEDVYCHGGLTYSEDHLLDLEKGWYIGWDYAHLGDYHPLIEPSGRQYSVSMLMADVTETICDL